MGRDLKISIVTPSYNQGRFIERTMLSVLNQTYRNFEYIVMDGASTDGSADIIARYADHLAYWGKGPDKGQTDALRQGFARATGDILGWLCSDDVLEPWTLEEVVEFFNSNPQAEVVYGDSHWIDADDRPLRPKKEHDFVPYIWYHGHNFVPQPSTFWRRGLYERVGGVDPQFNMAMDGDLWARFSAVTQMYHVPRRWSRMREHPDQKTGRRSPPASYVETKTIVERTLGVQDPIRSTVHRVTARTLRIGLKLLNGCYWAAPPEPLDYRLKHNAERF